MVEEDTNYQGNDINNGIFDLRKYDAMSCKAYCKSNYQSARYFTWVSPSAPLSIYHNTCWCKNSDSGKKHEQGEISGEVNCGDQGNESPLLLNSISKDKKIFDFRLHPR